VKSVLVLTRNSNDEVIYEDKFPPHPLPTCSSILGIFLLSWLRGGDKTVAKRERGKWVE
jgi:hypothetical protein